MPIGYYSIAFFLGCGKMERSIQNQPGNIGRFLNVLLSSTLRSDYLMIICPTVEFWKGDTLLAEHGRYLRVMISGMVDGLDQNQDGRDIIELPLIGKV